MVVVPGRADRVLKVDEEWIDRAESAYPGIAERMRGFERAVLPVCSHCGSDNTADVQCGLIGRTMFLCNSCGKYFGRKGRESSAKPGTNLDESDLIRTAQEHGGFNVKVEALKRGAHGRS